jgi:hypothetical protein
MTMKMKTLMRTKKSDVSPADGNPAERIAGVCCVWGAAEGPQTRRTVCADLRDAVGPDNRPVAGVTIKIRQAEKKKARWEHTSDRRGEFARRVPPGPADYVIWADLKDRQAAEKTAVKVHLNGDERRDIILHLNEQQTQKK